MTLTVDRSKFASPEAAYKHVLEARYLPRLMSALGVVRWVRVMEFQMKTGDGWPHWHVLVDKDGRFGRDDYRYAWKLWRDTWGVGGVDITNDKRFQGRAVGEIVRYLCKYMVKFPEKGFPRWVLAMSNVRFVQGSRNLGALVSGLSAVVPCGDDEVGTPDSVESDDVVAEGKKRFRWVARSVGERIAGCGALSLLFACDGQGNENYVARIPVRVGQVAIAARRGFLKGVSFETVSDGYGKSFVSLVLTRLNGETIDELAYRVQEGVAMLLHAEGAYIKPPPLPTGGEGVDSEEVASDRASVTALLALWRRWVRQGKLVYTEQEAVEGALAEPDDTYLLGLIDREEERTTVGE